MSKGGQTETLRILRMGQAGEGVAEDATGRVVFVQGALPGEVVEAEITEVRNNFSRARTQQVNQVTPHRVTPRCPISQECGGCVFQHWNYASELEYKENRVRQALIRIGQLANPKVERIQGAQEPYGYRNKGQFPWGGSVGQAYLGLYAHKSHKVVATSHCDIQDVVVNQVLEQMPAIVNRLQISPYDEASGRGVLRHLLVRTNGQGEALVLFIVRAWDDRLKLAADRVMADVPRVVGVGANLNAANTNRVLGPQTQLIRGQSSVVESILGAQFNLSFESFFQVNPRQVGRLYGLVLDALDEAGPPLDTVWDLYAGVGTLAILAADRAKTVRALELSPEAVRDARANIALNQVKNVTMTVGRAEHIILDWVRSSALPPSAVIVDPPRAGLAREVVESLLSLKSQKLIYVSCNPETLARDVALMTETYDLTAAHPVDMFPRTDHVETVALLELRERR